MSFIVRFLKGELLMKEIRAEPQGSIFLRNLRRRNAEKGQEYERKLYQSIFHRSIRADQFNAGSTYSSGTSDGSMQCARLCYRIDGIYISVTG